MGLVSASASDTGKRSVCDGKNFQTAIKTLTKCRCCPFSKLQKLISDSALHLCHSDWPAYLVSWMSVCLNPQGDAFLLGAGCGTKLVISPASPPKRSRAPGWHVGKTRASLSGSGAHQAFIAQWIRVLPPAHSDTMSPSRRDQSGSCVGTLLLLQFGEDITGRCGWVNGRRQTTVARVQKSSPALRRTAQCVPARWKPFQKQKIHVHMKISMSEERLV